MAFFSDRGGCCFSSFVICSGCGWPIPPLLLVEGMLTDFVGGSLAEPGHARSEEPGEAEQRRQVLDHAKHMPGLRFRAQIWMLRVAKAWPRPCPSAVQASCALDLAFPFRPLGLMVARRILKASTLLVSSSWLGLGSPGARAL